jgi:hypothetical protein
MPEPKWLAEIDPVCDEGLPAVCDTVEKLLAHIRELREALGKAAERIGEIPGMCAAYECDWDGKSRKSCSSIAEMTPCGILAPEMKALLSREEPPEVK